MLAVTPIQISKRKGERQDAPGFSDEVVSGPFNRDSSCRSPKAVFRTDAAMPIIPPDNIIAPRRAASVKKAPFELTRLLSFGQFLLPLVHQRPVDGAGAEVGHVQIAFETANCFI